MKKTTVNFFLLSLILFLTLSCSNKEKSVECSTFLECLDSTYWTTNNNKSIWTFNDKKNGEYLEVYISGDNCYTYENNFIVNYSLNSAYHSIRQVEIFIIKNYMSNIK